VFFVSGPWNIGELRRRLPPALQQSWMTAPLPGPDGPGASIAGGSSLVLFRHARVKPAAWQLIEFLSRPDIQRRFHALTGDLPPRRSAWREGALADDPYARAFREQLERVKPTPPIPEWERIANEIRLAEEQVADGRLGVQAAQRELDARTDVILEKRRALLARRGSP
jgi:multiple sugar transport system substrate-binding protein